MTLQYFTLVPVERAENRENGSSYSAYPPVL